MAALFLSMATLIFGALGLRNRSTKDYIESLERRIAAAEKEIKECHDRHVKLESDYRETRQDNYELMRRLLARDSSTGGGAGHWPEA